jgi:hypothetical protein
LLAPALCGGEAAVGQCVVVLDRLQKKMKMERESERSSLSLPPLFRLTTTMIDLRLIWVVVVRQPTV